MIGVNAVKESMLFRRRDLPTYVHIPWIYKWGLKILKGTRYRRVMGFPPGDESYVCEWSFAADP